MRDPSLEKPLSTAGMAYNRRHDISYRAGLVLQVLGAGLLAVLYPMTSPFYTAGIMLFELGVLLSAVHLLVWITWIRKVIVGAVLVGIPLQLFGQWLAPPQLAGDVILAGIGLVCIGAAGMAGKEAYCFSFREGWVLMWLLPIMALLNLALRESVVLNSLGFSAIFLLMLSLTGKKLKQPVRTSGPGNGCGEPH